MSSKRCLMKDSRSLKSLIMVLEELSGKTRYFKKTEIFIFLNLYENDLYISKCFDRLLNYGIVRKVDKNYYFYNYFHHSIEYVLSVLNYKKVENCSLTIDDVSDFFLYRSPVKDVKSLTDSDLNEYKRTIKLILEKGHVFKTVALLERLMKERIKLKEKSEINVLSSLNLVKEENGVISLNYNYKFMELLKESIG